MVSNSLYLPIDRFNILNEVSPQELEQVRHAGKPVLVEILRERY